MDFSQALHSLKHELVAVARKGWNGKGMFLYLVPAPARGYPAQTGVAKEFFGEEALVPYTAYIAMKTADNQVTPWAPSQMDMLADDWVIVTAKDGRITAYYEA